LASTAAAAAAAATGETTVGRKSALSNPVRLAAAEPSRTASPLDLAQSASLRRRVQTLQQREPGRTHFPQSSLGGGGPAAPSSAPFSSAAAAAAAPNPNLSLRLPRAASGIHAALGLRSTATPAPPSLAKAHQLVTAAR